MLDVHNDAQNYPKKLNEILKKKTHKCAPIQTKFLTKSKLLHQKLEYFLLSHLASLSSLFFFSSSVISSRGQNPIGAESCLGPPQKASQQTPIIFLK